MGLWNVATTLGAVLKAKPSTDKVSGARQTIKVIMMLNNRNM